MPLIKCPDCSRECSDQAPTCPACGRPILREPPKPGTANIAAGFASFLIPGLGQLLQGRVLWGIVHFVLAVILWIAIPLGWIIHILSAYNAATFVPGKQDSAAA